LRPGSDESDKAQGGAGTEDGEVKFVLELKVDEIVDWLWEELKLPTSSRSAALARRARLCARGLGQARRALRASIGADGEEAVKRRAIQEARSRSSTRICAFASSSGARRRRSTPR
jgi:uncharacterized sporulation protein YeaH/YhbH (DUF444 family)